MPGRHSPTLEPQLRTTATSLYSLMRNIGASIGISVVIWLLGRNAQVLHAELGAHITPFDPFLRHLPAPWDLATAAGRAGLDAELTRQAITIRAATPCLLNKQVAKAERCRHRALLG